jgi:hypothetical protein
LAEPRAAQVRFLFLFKKLSREAFDELVFVDFIP